MAMRIAATNGRPIWPPGHRILPLKGKAFDWWQSECSAKRVWARSGSGTLAMQCPQETALFDWLAQGAHTSATQSMRVHLSTCASCASIVEVWRREDKEEQQNDLETRPSANSRLARAIAQNLVESQSDALESVIPRGTRIGRYVVTRWLGRGGMGVVYEASDPELDRLIAIKLGRSSGFGSIGLSSQLRLQREGRVMAKLAHPNVVRVYDVGRWLDHPFVAMELVVGRSLSQWYRDSKPSHDQVVNMFIQAGRGLAAAHNADIVHGDFKPDNILVSDDDVAKVADFGLAVATTDRDWTESEATHNETSHSTAGTPCYMAPERLRGSQPDARSDQFSYCVSLLEALTGTRTFSSNNPSQVLAEMNESLPEVTFSAKIPATLARILKRGLAIDPRKRFASMDALLTQIERKPRRVWRRLAMAALALTALGFAAAIVPSGHATVRDHHLIDDHVCNSETAADDVWNDEARKALHAAVAANHRVSNQVEADQTATRFDSYVRKWNEAYRHLCQTQVAGAKSSTAGRQRALTCLQRRLDRLVANVDLSVNHNEYQHSLWGTYSVFASARQLPQPHGCLTTSTEPVELPTDPTQRRTIRRLQAALERVRALQHAYLYADAHTLATSVAHDAQILGYAPVQAEALFLQTYWPTSPNLTAPLKGAATLRRAAALAREANEHELEIHITLRLARLLSHDSEHWDEALRMTSAVLEQANSAARPSVNAHAFWTRGMIHERAGNDHLAIANYRRAFKHIRGSLAYNNLWPHSLEKFIALLFEAGKTQQALETIEQSRTASKATFGPNAPQVATLELHIGAVYQEHHEYDRARSAFHNADQNARLTLGADHPFRAEIVNRLAILEMQLDRHAQAEQHYREAIRLWSQTLGATHVRVGKGLNNLGILYTEMGRWHDADRVLQEALTIWEAGLPKDSPELAAILTNLGESKLGQDLPLSAQDFLERALVLRSTRVTPPARRAVTQFHLARALWRTGDRVRAITLADAAEMSFAAHPVRYRTELDQVRTWLAERHAVFGDAQP